jgi:hypothetical protein
MSQQPSSKAADEANRRGRITRTVRTAGSCGVVHAASGQPATIRQTQRQQMRQTGGAEQQSLEGPAVGGGHAASDIPGAVQQTVPTCCASSCGAGHAASDQPATNSGSHALRQQMRQKGRAE